MHRNAIISNYVISFTTAASMLAFVLTVFVFHLNVCLHINQVLHDLQMTVSATPMQRSLS